MAAIAGGLEPRRWHHAHDEGHDDACMRPNWTRCHESPLAMLVPLAVLATGRGLAGCVFAQYFIGEAQPRSGTASIFVAKARKASCRCGWSWRRSPSPSSAFLVAYYYYILHPDLPRKLAARRGLLYLFLYNKWYFDELYDFLFVRPHSGSAACCGSGATARSSTGSGPTAFGAGAGCGARRGPPAIGLCLSLCAGDAAGRGGARDLVHGEGGRAVMSLPILSLVTFLPLLGVLAHSLVPRAPMPRAGSRLSPPSSPSSCRCWCGRRSTRTIPASSWSSNAAGWAAAFPIIWAWTAFRCCSWC